MENLKKIGNARPHEFKSGTKIFDAGIQQTKIDGIAVNDKRLFDASIVQEGEKYIIYQGKVPNSIHLTINIDKITNEPENNGFKNFVVAPRSNQEQDNSQSSISNYTVYVPEKDGREVVYLGWGSTTAENQSLGLVFKETIKPKNGPEFNVYDMVLDKQVLLAVPPSEKHQDSVYINVAPVKGKENLFFAYPSKSMDDEAAIFTISLEHSKLSIINENEKGETRLTIKYKQEKYILKDNANLAVVDSSTLKNTEDTLYVGKGWDVEHMYWRNNKEKGQDFFLQAGNVVQFKVSDNYYLNSTMGVKDHIAFGTFTGFAEDGKLRVDSVCGNFILDKLDVRKSDMTSLENFNNSYGALVNAKKEDKVKHQVTKKTHDTEQEKPTGIPQEKKVINKGRSDGL